MTREKPNKPNPSFPLFAHASGQWEKTIKGKHYYFGAWDKPQEALAGLNREKRDLLEGRTPDHGDGLTVRRLINQFLTNKKRLVESKMHGRKTLGYHFASADRSHTMASQVIARLRTCSSSSSALKPKQSARTHSVGKRSWTISLSSELRSSCSAKRRYRGS
jgi:hypothetical protein